MRDKIFSSYGVTEDGTRLFFIDDDDRMTVIRLEEIYWVDPGVTPSDTIRIISSNRKIDLAFRFLHKQEVLNFLKFKITGKVKWTSDNRSNPQF